MKRGCAKGGKLRLEVRLSPQGGRPEQRRQTL